MPRHAPPDPDAVQHAIDEMAKGRSTREVAAELQSLGVSVSHVTVARWAKAGKPESTAAPREQPTAPSPSLPSPTVATPAKPSALATELAARKAAAPPPPPVDTSDTLGTLRSLLESFVGDAHRTKEGNPRLAATLSKAATEVLDQIRKIEARQAEDQSMLRISREEIAKTKAAMLERFQALCTKPLLCGGCGRKLSIAWGDAHEKVAEAGKSEGA